MPEGSGSTSYDSVKGPRSTKEDSLGGWTAQMMFQQPVGRTHTLSRLRSLVVQGMGLTVVDVRSLPSLEVIDLRNNALEVCVSVFADVCVCMYLYVPVCARVCVGACVFGCACAGALV